MSEQEIIEKLQTIAQDVLGDSEIKLSKKTKLVDLGVHSFALIQLVCAVENEFDISFSNADIKSLKDVSSIVKYIQKKTK